MLIFLTDIFGFIQRSKCHKFIFRTLHAFSISSFEERVFFLLHSERKKNLQYLKQSSHRKYQRAYLLFMGLYRFALSAGSRDDIYINSFSVRPLPVSFSFCACLTLGHKKLGSRWSLSDGRTQRKRRRRRRH